MNSAMFKKCKIASAKLAKELKDNGLYLSGYGVGLSLDTNNPAIIINLFLEKDKKLVPSVYQDFEVKVRITGKSPM